MFQNALWKYLQRLAKKGPAEAKLAKDLNETMRARILGTFANSSLSNEAAQKLARAQWAKMKLESTNPLGGVLGSNEWWGTIRKSKYPDVSYKQWKAATDKYRNKIKGDREKTTNLLKFLDKYHE